MRLSLISCLTSENESLERFVLMQRILFINIDRFKSSDPLPINYVKIHMKAQLPHTDAPLAFISSQVQPLQHYNSLKKGKQGQNVSNVNI